MGGRILQVAQVDPGFEHGTLGPDVRAAKGRDFSKFHPQSILHKLERARPRCKLAPPGPATPRGPYSPILECPKISIEDRPRPRQRQLLVPTRLARFRGHVDTFSDDGKRFPAAWHRLIDDELEPGEVVVGWFLGDLDQKLHYAESVVVLTNRRVLSIAPEGPVDGQGNGAVRSWLLEDV